MVRSKHDPTKIVKRRNNSLPKFKPGSRPEPNTVCTYNLGHVRQDVYACRKCTPSFAAQLTASGPTPDGRVGLDTLDGIAGFCGGCRKVCHGDHLDDVIDLYSKRAFRCDCGNGRMKNRCGLNPNKPSEPAAANVEVYNHNFVGKYCRCDRGYDLSLGDMLQCAVCEDWFHETCFLMPNRSKPSECNLPEIACELICKTCAPKMPFLYDYFADIGYFQPVPGPGYVTDVAVSNADCKRPDRVVVGSLRGRDLFWPPGFRTKLCQCPRCMDMYAKLACAYLVDRKDFVSLQGVEDDDEEEEVEVVEVVPEERAVPKAVGRTADRKRRRSAFAGSDPELSDGDYDGDDDDDDFEVSKKRPRSRPSRSVRKKEKVRSLPDNYKKYIQTRVSSFLREAMSQPGYVITSEDVKHHLAKIRAEVMEGDIPDI